MQEQILHESQPHVKVSFALSGIDDFERGRRHYKETDIRDKFCVRWMKHGLSLHRPISRYMKRIAIRHETVLISSIFDGRGAKSL